jgi:hypothetical protein
MMMATVFWDLEGNFLMEYMPHMTTIIGDACAAMLQNLKESVKEK